MAKPTSGPKTTFNVGQMLSGTITSPKMAASSVGPTAIAASAVIGSKLKPDSVGLTALADPLMRHVSVVTYGLTPATGHVVNVFRAPASGATIQAAYWGPGTAQNHAVNEADTWIVALKNAKTGLRLSSKQCSLSCQTLAATQFKTIPVNAGRSTLNSGEVLTISCAPSGSPDKLYSPAVIIEWAPKNNV